MTALRALLEQVDPQPIDDYVDMLFDAWQEDRCVYLFGNGGSASCAGHHVADYVKTSQVTGQRRLRAYSLCDNVEMLTAISNDDSYDDVFRHPLESYGRPGDIAVAISCSGNSANVVRAIEFAAAHGIKTAAITGMTGGKIGALADVHMHIPSHHYGLIEDVQLSVGHIVAHTLRQKIAAQSNSA